MSTSNQIGSNLKSFFNFALQKGELGARVARLRLEIVSLTRSKESAFARLGRGYHANPSATADLEPLLREVDRIALEIRDRESVLTQLLQPKAPEPLPAPPTVSALGTLKAQGDTESPDESR
jgi:hypothetical protein